MFTAVKGVVPESMLTLGEHLNKNYNLSLNQIGVIGGPSHAEENGPERLSYLTIACMERPIAAQLAKMMKTTTSVQKYLMTSSVQNMLQCLRTFTP